MPTRTADTIRIVQQLAMLGGFAILLAEVRFEHRGVLLGDFRPWIPLGYCACMLFVIPACALFWQRGGRRLLRLAYGLSMVLGLVGLTFHSEGHLFARLYDLLKVWTMDISQSATLKAHYPPLLAPAAFIGLGTLGIILCLQEPAKADKRPSEALNKAQPAAKAQDLISVSGVLDEKSGACCAPEGDRP